MTTASGEIGSIVLGHSVMSDAPSSQSRQLCISLFYLGQCVLHLERVIEST